jgi:hypothetical protein
MRILLLLAALPALCQAHGQLNSKNPSLNNELVQKQLESEIRRRLAERGLTEAASQPDLNVRYSWAPRVMWKTKLILPGGVARASCERASPKARKSAEKYSPKK